MTAASPPWFEREGAVRAPCRGALARHVSSRRGVASGSTEPSVRDTRTSGSRKLLLVLLTLALLVRPSTYRRARYSPRARMDEGVRGRDRVASFRRDARRLARGCAGGVLPPRCRADTRAQDHNDHFFQHFVSSDRKNGELTGLRGHSALSGTTRIASPPRSSHVVRAGGPPLPQGRVGHHSVHSGTGGWPIARRLAARQSAIFNRSGARNEGIPELNHERETGRVLQPAAPRRDAQHREQGRKGQRRGLRLAAHDRRADRGRRLGNEPDPRQPA